ncbi:YeiH family protein [Jatrophihabitans cynanchi]|uniref:YeiH family protein n=1 Tax=Jatrophihabitans cynanchi TaxID=2944128 RepID=A0ABY7K5L5_9ACTN|nr:YeiH family protein [Jatrophihabitans sp. SB3-54]WAX58619.1 YeiH family protein [Jatrophihabitans sp. SB3-54]
MSATTRRADPLRACAPLVPGVALAAAIALVATGIGHALPLLGAPVAGLLLGVALSRAVAARPPLQPGVAFAGRTLLQVAVVLLGSALSLRQVAHVGASSLPVMLGTLAVCLALAYLLGRWLGIGRDLRTLIGVGTGICGASAIAAVSPVIRARSADVAYAISTIFLFNLVAVLAFPPLGHLLGLSQHDFGLFAGTAVNDTSSVVAAASTYGSSATDYAVVVKLTRTLMIIPICLGLAALTRSGEREASALRRVTRLVPWFLVGFIVLAALNSLGWVPSAAHQPLRDASVFLITLALTAIGLRTDVAGLRRAGSRPLLLGLLLWVAVAGTSLVLQWAAG